jgi:hypothetical protein
MLLCTIDLICIVCVQKGKIGKGISPKTKKMLQGHTNVYTQISTEKMLIHYVS